MKRREGRVEGREFQAEGRERGLRRKRGMCRRSMCNIFRVCVFLWLIYKAGFLMEYRVQLVSISKKK